jgi:phage N-6-adenine-methyltransferase
LKFSDPLEAWKFEEEGKMIKAAELEAEDQAAKSGASFNRGKSRQDFATPSDFREAVVKRFGRPDWDLAADDKNWFCPEYFDEEQDSLKLNWHTLNRRLLWLNPPFGDITPWAKKCAEESTRGALILFLTPASVGANWFSEHVHNKARVYFLSPRLSFDGKNPFPKDCMLSVYGLPAGYECWRWKP